MCVAYLSSTIANKRLKKCRKDLVQFLCVGFLYAQTWKDLQIPTKDEWMVKSMGLAEMVKLITLMWKLVLDFLLENERNKILMLGFHNENFL